MNEINLAITPKRFQAAHEAGHATIAKYFNFSMNHIVIKGKIELPSNISPHVSLKDPREANTEFFAGGVAGVLFADFPDISTEIFNEIKYSNKHFTCYTQGFDEDVQKFKAKMREINAEIHTDYREYTDGRVILSRDRTFVPNTFVDKIYDSYLLIRKEETAFNKFKNILIEHEFVGRNAAHSVCEGLEYNPVANERDLLAFSRIAKGEQFKF